MSLSLSLSLVEQLEDHISNNNPLKKHEYLGMKISDMEKGKKTFVKLKENNFEYPYIIFGSNGGGYQSFALYKAHDNNIYLFVVKMQDIETYELIDNVEWFDQCGI
jgi:hypothetical protein